MRCLPAPVKPKRKEHELSYAWVPDRGKFWFDADADRLPLRLRYEMRRWNREKKIREPSPVIYLPATMPAPLKLLPVPVARETRQQRFDRIKHERQAVVRQSLPVIQLHSVAGGLKCLPAPRIAGYLPAPRTVTVIPSASAADRLIQQVIAAADEFAIAAGRAAYLAAKPNYKPFEVRDFSS